MMKFDYAHFILFTVDFKRFKVVKIAQTTYIIILFVFVLLSKANHEIQSTTIGGIRSFIDDYGRIT